MFGLATDRFQQNCIEICISTNLYLYIYIYMIAFINTPCLKISHMVTQRSPGEIF